MSAEIQERQQQVWAARPEAAWERAVRRSIRSAKHVEVPLGEEWVRAVKQEAYELTKGSGRSLQAIEGDTLVVRLVPSDYSAYRIPVVGGY